MREDYTAMRQLQSADHPHPPPLAGGLFDS
jgi:hypothetical protein